MIKSKSMRWFLYSYILLLAAPGFAQDGYFHDQKSVKKTFSIKQNAHLEVENKYGHIFFETWEKDSVKIEVEVVATSRKEENMFELMSLAVIDLNASGSFVVARTNWGKNASLWSQTKNELRNVFGSDQKVEITYHISLPDGMSIKASNKFGDIYLPAYKGIVEIDISHGDLRSRKIENPRIVKMSYGSLRVDQWGSGELQLAFAEMHTRKSAELKIVSRSSKLFIDNAGHLDFDSKNDELHIGEVQNFMGSLHFTTGEVDVLTGSLDLVQNYGSLTINLLKEQFTTVKVKSKKSDLNIKVPENASFDFQVYLTNGLEFSSVPKMITMTRDEDVGEQRQMEGFWKSAKTGRSISIFGESSQIKLGEI